MKKIKTVFQILCVIMCISLYTNCDNDDIDKNFEALQFPKQQLPFTTQLVDKENYRQNVKLNNQLKRLTKPISSSISKNTDGLYNFSVNSETAILIENIEDSSHSYTFSIKRESNTENVLENLVFSYDVENTDYTASLVTYHFTKSQEEEFLLTNHVSSAYTVSSELLALNLSDVINKNTMPLPCTTNFSVYHITPAPNSETFLQSSTIGNVYNDCQHEDVNGDTLCETYTIITYDCPEGGGSDSSSTTTSSSSSGDSDGNNSNNSQQIITTPRVDKGDWLIENLGIVNLHMTDDDLEIINWIHQNDQPENNLFIDVYEFYIENQLEPIIINIVSDVILVLNEDSSLTFQEALFQVGYIILDLEPTIVNPAEELSCFDLSQGAKLTIYIQQPQENSTKLVGPNQVGHVFIGIEQGEIVRQIGYYPNQDVGPTGIGQDFEAAIKTNYDELYHVSISKNVTSSQLASIVNYSINFPPTYNTNNYACVDFGINIGNLGGMNLPSTTVSDLLFNGRSPGVLGQEVRARDSDDTITITKIRNNSPSRQGGCLGSN